jgi:LAS superfamily LD-carboxypeptidase LdcB
MVGYIGRLLLGTNRRKWRGQATANRIKKEKRTSALPSYSEVRVGSALPISEESLDGNLLLI